MNIYQLLKTNSLSLFSYPESKRVLTLNLIAEKLLLHKATILEENRKDVSKASSDGLSNVLIDRLTIDSQKITSMAKACAELAKQDAVLGFMHQSHKRSNGLEVHTQRIPLGMLAMVFESRPNVVIDAIALAIKSGNGLILKGGKEAQFTNKCLFEIANAAFESIYKSKVFHYLESREEFHFLLKQNSLIDLVIARGGSELVRYVKNEATMPVMCHDKGLCHIYIHEDADVGIVEKIILNAKTSRPGVCNALESLVIHKNYPLLNVLLDNLLNNHIELRGCSESVRRNNKVLLASTSDYDTEYLSMILSVKIVDSLDEAIEHIKVHSSHHTEAILANNKSIIEIFLNSLDSSCMLVNASTRFNDGGELGLGAELGISTSKFHAYGPVGAKQMTTKRFVVFGSGQIR